ncbi:MAG: class I SAM-dependent methyltransferase [Xanthobacteraceae bacterium]
MNTSHWDSIYQGRPQHEPQSKRYAEIAAGVKQQISSLHGRALLLTVSPSLSNIEFDVTAVDRNDAVVRNRWPGNTPNRRAVVADWRQLPFASGSFSLCVGDGSMNMLDFPHDVTAVLENLERVLLPSGRFVCRMYLTPDRGEAISDVVKATWNGEVRSFVYFKFRLAMAIAAERGHPRIPVRTIREAFVAYFPDRIRLSAATGWDHSEIDRIDLYELSPEIYNFPTRRQVLSILPGGFSNARFVPVGTYELAERCPLLVMEMN